MANGVSTRFVYDGGQLTGEVDGNGVMIRRYVPLPGPDETLAMVDSTGVSYPLADSRGTPMAWALADGSLAVQGYGAFGEESGSNIGRFGFTGQMRLPEIGLHYYKARFYDPQIGRFLTPDPAGMVDGPNLYAYVLNDPINFTDPSGLYITQIGNGVYSCTRPGVSIDGEEPRFGGVRCTFLYSVAEEPDTSTNPGGGFRGSGGRGQAPPGMMESREGETPGCIVIEGEVALGAQVGASLKLPGFRVNILLDAGTFRFGARYTNNDTLSFSSRVTQGVAFELAVGLPARGIGFDFGGRFQRESSFSGSPPQAPINLVPFQASRSPDFFGVGASLDAPIGGKLQGGLEFNGGNGSCPPQF